MNKIKYSQDLMEFMSIFETITGTKLKDCIMDEYIIFIVQENQIAKAIGRNGSNVRKLQSILKKKIKIAEFNLDPLIFTKNLISPLKAKDIKIEGDVIIIQGEDIKTRGLLIGRNAKNLREYESIVQRYFPIKEIKVI